MRVVFLGYQTWGHRVLQALLDSPHEVPLVLTHPASRHEYERIWSDSVHDLARERGVPVLVRRRANDPAAACAISDAAPDILVSSDWRTWVAPQVCALARHGGVNVHDALLPRYGGFAPLNWALINGETEVGVTVHHMDEELDLGDIVLQRRVAVGPEDTATDLFHRTIDLFPELALEALELIASGRATRTPQDRGRATFFHKRSTEDSRIDWTWPARDIANLVRAQSDPYPNAFSHYEGRRLRLLAARPSARRCGGSPGRIVSREGDAVVVVCGPSARSGNEPGLLVDVVRTESGDEIAAGDFFRPLGGSLQGIEPRLYSALAER